MLDTRMKASALPDRQAHRRLIVEHRFTTPFGGDITKSDDRRAYCILFARPRTLDASVRVYRGSSSSIRRDRWAKGGTYMIR
jgi:hypothetical protein